MTLDSPLDPRHARLVALLYDELPAGDERALRAELARDAGLRAEWEELVGTRHFLQSWEIEERTPSFVFMEPPTALAPAAEPTTALRLVSRTRSALTWAGWAVAAAALLFMGLTGKGTRFEKLNNGFAIRFGPTRQLDAAPSAAQASFDPGAAPAAGWPIASAWSRFGLTDANPYIAAPGGQTAGVHPGAESGEPGYITNSELDAHTERTLNFVARLLNEDRERRDREWASMLRGAYGDLDARQFAGYRDLRGRIDAVNVGVMLGRSAAGINPDGTPVSVPADTLKLKSRSRQPSQRNWKYGDFPDEPERF